MKIKTIKKLLNTSFTTLGILVLIWTALFLIKLKTKTNLETLIIGINLIAKGIYAILVVIGLILIYLLIKFIIKKFNTKK
jgi:hypothetical protein